MYKRILLASDSSREGLIALREGALLARMLQAKVFLLMIERISTGATVATAVHPMAPDDSASRLLAGSLERLASLGLEAAGEVQVGEPAPLIGASARRFRADLIVVGHRRQSLLERWWSGASGAYLVDAIDCSVLIARNAISDAEFEAHLASG